MCTSWEKVSKCIGTECGDNISDELKNKCELVTLEPTCFQDILMRHATQEQTVRTAQVDMIRAKQDQLKVLKAKQGAANTPNDLPATIAGPENEIAMLETEQNKEAEVKMTEEEETMNNDKWRTCWERKS